MTGMEERRRTPRQRVSFALVLDDGAVFHAGTARDVSEGGLFFETPAAPAVGSIVHVSPLDGPGLEVRARVIHLRATAPRSPEPAGLGLELVDAAERNVLLVDAILGHRPSTPRPPPRRTTIPPGQSGTS